MEESQAGASLTDRQIDALKGAVHERYGFEITELHPLGGELDFNFRAIHASGETRFVRLTPEGFDPASIAWQNTILSQLAHHPLSVHTPTLIAQHDGAVMSTVRLDSTLQATLRMTSWVPGKNIAELGATGPLLRRQIGSLASEIIESLSPIGTPQDRVYEHHWMVVKSGDSIRATIYAIDDPARHALVTTALERFEAVAHLIPRLPRTVVHQDLHDFNILAEHHEHGDTYISGVVDFNDAVLTARVAEVAVAAVYSGLRQNDPFAAFCDVLDGYFSRARLDELELELLYPLAVARLAVNASTWTYRGKIGNTAYAESRMEATWPALEQFLNVNPKDAAHHFRSLQRRAVEKLPQTKY